MTGMFNVKIPDFKKLCKKLADITNRAAAATLNDCAFKFRSQAVAALEAEYTIRSPAFVRRQMKVGQKAKPRGDIDDMEAEAGSVRAPRFSGWVEPMGGEGPERNRLTTLFARGGNPRNVVNPKKPNPLTG